VADRVAAGLPDHRVSGPAPWDTTLRVAFVPHISAAFFQVIIAVIGTTITRYMFF
jgi:hypothetical protein